MRRILFIGVAAVALASALVSPSAAKPGEKGDVQLTPTIATPPAGVSGGDRWDAAITFPAEQAEYIGEELRLYVRIEHPATGVVKVFSAGRTGRSSYLAPVVFPSAGRWTVEIVTPGETWPMSPIDVARSAPVAGPGFPAVAVTAGALALALLAAVLIVPRFRRARAVPAMR